MATPLNLDIDRRDDGTTVLVATGELDLSNVDVFTHALADAVAEKDSGVVAVDLSRVEYLDSAAINALYGHTDQIQLIANPLLMPVLTISGLADVVPVQPAGPSS
ncbi:MAG: hypothetical protein QOH57_2022 [Mycobacterium sp.]|jgi:anti-anti-sigma factor|nr:hypothetical protein [Mycobacterium sp.]